MTSEEPADQVTRALIVCDGASVPRNQSSQSWTTRRNLHSSGADANLNLFRADLGVTVLKHISDRALDLINIASYAYAADQIVSRGGETDVYGRSWRRELALCVPVEDVDLWSHASVQKYLQAVLNFGTDDTWSFAFSPASPHRSDPSLFAGFDDADLHGNPDSVLLFSGGLDSLCAAIAAVVTDGRRPALVSHQPSHLLDSRQNRLVEALVPRVRSWRFPHRSFAIHRRGSDASDTSQRTRGFLFASLGAAIAAQLGLVDVFLPDNGVISLNLMSYQAPGAMASRTTHPRFLMLFNELLAAVFPAPIRVTNPLWSKTRSEVLETLRSAGAEGMLPDAISCSHYSRRRRDVPQCGGCSQCVDRRFGVLAAGLGAFDPADRYELDIFHEPLPAEGESRTVPISYVNFAQEIDPLSDDGILAARPQLYDCVPRDESASRAMTALVSLLRRHASDVLRVMEEAITEHRRQLVRKELAQDSLIWLALGAAPSNGESEPCTNCFRKDGETWAIAFNGMTARFKDSKGLRYIYVLVRNEGRSVPALKLASMGASGTLGSMSEQDAEAAGIYDIGPGDPDPILDDQAMKSIHAEMERNLREQNVARERGDSKKLSRLQSDFDAMQNQVLTARGLGGSIRTFPNAEHKTPRAVAKTLKRTIEKIETSHPALGRHLRRCIEPGHSCTYTPDQPPHWSF